MTSQAKQITSLAQKKAYKLFCYHRILYTICVQFAHFISKFKSILGLGVLICLIADVRLKFQSDLIFGTEFGQCVSIPVQRPLYVQYVVKFCGIYIIYFMYFLCFPGLEFQSHINEYLTYFNAVSIRSHCNKSSRSYFLYRQTAHVRQIHALESCKIFPKVLLDEIELTAFELPSISNVCRTPPAFTGACRIIIASFFIYVFRIFVNNYFYAFCMFYLYPNYIQSFDPKSINILMNFLYCYNICAAGFLSGYLLVVQFPSLM